MTYYGDFSVIYLIIVVYTNIAGYKSIHMSINIRSHQIDLDSSILLDKVCLCTLTLVTLTNFRNVSI